MIYFPNISLPSYPFDEEFEDTTIRSKFEDGSQQSRRKFTRSRRTWTVKWQGLSNSDYVRLKNFIRDEAKFGAVSFMWTNPGSLTSPEREVIEVRIANVGKFTMSTMDRWDGELTLQEV